nr:hypothetical protein [uncultured Ruminococcus sp.]
MTNSAITFVLAKIVISIRFTVIPIAIIIKSKSHKPENEVLNCFLQ